MGRIALSLWAFTMNNRRPQKSASILSCISEASLADFLGHEDQERPIALSVGGPTQGGGHSERIPLL